MFFHELHLVPHHRLRIAKIVTDCSERIGWGSQNPQAAGQGVCLFGCKFRRGEKEVGGGRGQRSDLGLGDFRAGGEAALRGDCHAAVPQGCIPITLGCPHNHKVQPAS